MTSACAGKRIGVNDVTGDNSLSFTGRRRQNAHEQLSRGDELVASDYRRAISFSLATSPGDEIVAGDVASDSSPSDIARFCCQCDRALSLIIHVLYCIIHTEPKYDMTDLCY